MESLVVARTNKDDPAEWFNQLYRQAPPRYFESHP